MENHCIEGYFEIVNVESDLVGWGRIGCTGRLKLDEAVAWRVHLPVIAQDGVVGQYWNVVVETHCIEGYFEIVNVESDLVGWGRIGCTGCLKLDEAVAWRVHVPVIAQDGVVGQYWNVVVENHCIEGYFEIVNVESDLVGWGRIGCTGRLKLDEAVAWRVHLPVIAQDGVVGQYWNVVVENHCIEGYFEIVNVESDLVGWGRIGCTGRLKLDEAVAWRVHLPVIAQDGVVGQYWNVVVETHCIEGYFEIVNVESDLVGWGRIGCTGRLKLDEAVAWRVHLPVIAQDGVVGQIGMWCGKSLH